jgi:hypothetical protein
MYAICSESGETKYADTPSLVSVREVPSATSTSLIPWKTISRGTSVVVYAMWRESGVHSKLLSPTGRLTIERGCSPSASATTKFDSA